MMYEVHILKEGYSRPMAPGKMKAGGTITLLKGPQRNIIVDTGGPSDKDVLLQGLSKHNLAPADIGHVVCTHGHSDHVGNINLFPDALHVVGFDICRHDEYILHDFKQGIPFEIDECVEVLPTPGHTGNDVSVVVRCTRHGVVVIAGDLFECEQDLDVPSLWQDNSEHPRLQQQGRMRILRLADWIVPGHGPMFEVPRESKQQLRMVMITEESHCTLICGNGSETHTACIIVEMD